MSDIRALDANGEWTFGNGTGNYLSGPTAIALDIKTALKTFLGEAFWATNFGVDWWNLLGGKDEAAIILQCRTIIAGRADVTRINSVEATVDRNTRQMLLSFNIDTIFSRNSQNTVAVP